MVKESDKLQQNSKIQLLILYHLLDANNKLSIYNLSKLTKIDYRSVKNKLNSIIISQQFPKIQIDKLGKREYFYIDKKEQKEQIKQFLKTTKNDFKKLPKSSKNLIKSLLDNINIFGGGGSDHD